MIHWNASVPIIEEGNHHPSPPIQRPSPQCAHYITNQKEKKKGLIILKVYHCHLIWDIFRFGGYSGLNWLGFSCSFVIVPLDFVYTELFIELEKKPKNSSVINGNLQIYFFFLQYILICLKVHNYSEKCQCAILLLYNHQVLFPVWLQNKPFHELWQDLIFLKKEKEKRNN